MICWKIRIFAYWTTPKAGIVHRIHVLWFAEKFVSLLIEQHLGGGTIISILRCDLLKNSYLCLLNNTNTLRRRSIITVVICWKIRIFAYWTTPFWTSLRAILALWFAEKFVSLLIEQHPAHWMGNRAKCCDLLKNSYLCLLNNTFRHGSVCARPVVICWKIRIFAYWTTPSMDFYRQEYKLWFAEKFVSLLIEQHLSLIRQHTLFSCDLLKNSYLCLLNNTVCRHDTQGADVVICWKIRIFAYWTTPIVSKRYVYPWLWFAEKFVSLLIEQHQEQ